MKKVEIAFSSRKLPTYEGEDILCSEEIYNSDKTFMSLCNENIPRAEMTIVSNTSKTEFENYVGCLKDNGFEHLTTEIIENNEYATLTDGTAELYLYYTDKTKAVRIIYDTVSAFPSEISLIAGKVVSLPEFYMYGLDMESSILPNSGKAGAPAIGMLLIAKCADNSVIMVDGGKGYHTRGECGEKLNNFLHSITNTPNNEKVKIASWYLTHTDGDHLWGFENFIKDYRDKYELNSICANIPFEFLKIKYPAEYEPAREFSRWLCENYPECKEIKIHTGQRLEFSGVTMQAIYTHEDRVEPITGTSDVVGRSLNHSSTAIKMQADGISMMVLGDILATGEECILKAFTKSTLKSDIVQVSHHTFDGASQRLYDAINADIYLAPVSYGRYCLRHYSSKLRSIYPDFNAIFKDKSVYFCGRPEYTVGFSSIDGQVRTICEPQKAPVFDIDDEETQSLAIECLGEAYDFQK